MAHDRLRLLLGRRLRDRRVAVAVADDRLFVLGMLQPDVLDVLAVVDLRHFLSRADLDRGQGLRHLELHRLDHRAEQLERLALVLLLGVLLRVPAQVNPLAQMVERGEVLAPVRIDNLQRHVTLVLAK